MNEATLRTALIEAERFVAKVKALNDVRPAGKHYITDFPKESGAVKRASMDLTRALADLRRPG